MPSPTGDDIRHFARELFRTRVVSTVADASINVMGEFAEYLISKGHSRIVSDEYAERHITHVIELIHKRADEWSILGVKSPIHILDNGPQLITWAHPLFVNISGKQAITSDFCAVLDCIRHCDSREFLGYGACYLFALGCERIFITDTSGDGGIDLVGVFNRGPMRNVCVFVQSKTVQPKAGEALGMVNKDTLLCDYSKYLLLRKMPQWNEYCQSSGLMQSIDGMGCIFMFLSNSEFKPGLREAAIGLEVLLRSGLQIAASITELGSLVTIQAALEAMRPFSANISKNLAKTLQHYFVQ